MLNFPKSDRYTSKFKPFDYPSLIQYSTPSPCLPWWICYLLLMHIFLSSYYMKNIYIYNIILYVHRFCACDILHVFCNLHCCEFHHQGSASLFCKWQDSDYFRLYGPYMVSVSYSCLTWFSFLTTLWGAKI